MENLVEPAKRYFTLNELARYTGLSTFTLRRYMEKLNLPHFRTSRKILIRIDEFEKWMEDRRQHQQAEVASLDALVDEVVAEFDL